MASIKVLHIVSLLLFLTATSVTFFVNSVGFKIVSALSALAILFTGLWLVFIFGSFPLWALAKGVIWIFLMAFAHVAVKHFKPYRVASYIFMMLLAAVAVYLAVQKPL